MRPTHELLALRRRIGSHALQELSGTGLNQNGVTVVLSEKALLDRMVEETGQLVEIPFDVQDPRRLGMDAQLAPGEDLEKSFQGADPAWQRDEAIGHVGHLGFALVHGSDHDEVPDTGVGGLLLHQLLGDDAGDVSTVLLNRVGQLAHDAHAGATVHQLDVLLGQHPAELAGGNTVPRAGPGIGAAKHAESVQRTIGWHAVASDA
jgi:hypothetical protein